MFDEHERRQILSEILQNITDDRKILDGLIQDLRNHGIKSNVKKIQHYVASTLAIVSSDAGNHNFKFDPFHHQLIRVVDSYGESLAIKAVTLSTDLEALFISDTTPDPKTGRLGAIGHLVADLRRATGDTIDSYKALCPSISINPDKPEKTTGWVVSYRDLWEWAVFYHRIVHADFYQSTLIIRDGPLRSKLFAKDYFRIMGDLMAERVKFFDTNKRKKVYIAGLAKHSSVLDLYRLALAMEDVFPAGNPYYVRIPREIEMRSYKFPEYARGRERLIRGADGLCAVRETDGRLTTLGVRRDAPDVEEDSKFVFGSMYFVRFAPDLSMPIWSVDIFDDQTHMAEDVIGHLLGDSVEGFPVPAYPMAIQRAHEAAKLTDFDADIINRALMSSVRDIVDDADIVDRLELAGDLAARRY